MGFGPISEGAVLKTSLPAPITAAHVLVYLTWSTLVLSGYASCKTGSSPHAYLCGGIELQLPRCREPPLSVENNLRLHPSIPPGFSISSTEKCAHFGLYAAPVKILPRRLG